MVKMEPSSNIVTFFVCVPLNNLSNISVVPFEWSDTFNDELFSYASVVKKKKPRITVASRGGRRRTTASATPITTQKVKRPRKLKLAAAAAPTDGAAESIGA